jgi:hypothetical protein
MEKMNRGNIKIVPGKNISYHPNSRVNCNFSYIEFKDVETTQFDIDPERSEETKAALHKIMTGKNGLIWMRPIGGENGTGKLGIGEHGLQIEILSPKDKAMYDRFPCGMSTPAGSIIPQIIVPTTFYEPIDHGMRYPEGVVANPSQESAYGVGGESSSSGANGGENGSEGNNSEGDNPPVEDSVGEGYNWEAQPLDVENLDIRRFSREYIQKKLSSYLTYGERDGINKAVTNEHSAKLGVDTPVRTKKSYICHLDKTPAGPGSCAICYKFVEHDPVGKGITDEEKRQTPMLIVKMAGVEQNDVDENDESENGEEQQPSGGNENLGNVLEQPDAIVIVIPENGEALGSVNTFVGQGAMSLPEIDLMPPQCKKNEGDYTMKPIFFYPIYSGFLMTNSAVNNLHSGENGIFIKYNNQILNPIYTARISGVEKSDEVNKWIKKDKNTELMKWFPPLYQETNDKNAITLKIPKKHNIVFGKDVSVDWMKANGRFAYCPVFFHRSLKFTYYFKGEYISENESIGTYRFYPLVCANIGDTTEERWTGISNDGASCINKDGVGIVEGRQAIRLVHSDPDIEESIYAVDFIFESDGYQRYPIEVFGAIAVYERPDFQFSVENSNGDFQFDKEILPVFTGAYKNQLNFSSMSCNPPDVGNHVNLGGSKLYYGLLMNLNLSSGEDGVTGSMTLDGYPLKQGIRVLKQEQSIGEIDFAVSVPGFYDHDKWMESGSDEIIENLFSGYGMEISTSDSENNYSINVQLQGVYKKMEDMQLLCAPFWDGDRLEMISAYFEEYLHLQIKMIDYEVHSYDKAKPVSDNLYSPVGTWRAEPNTIINQQSKNASEYTFRVPRSIDWRSPKVAFATGTTCLSALKDLGRMTGCHCIPQLDGTIVFYELNNFGYPFYVDNQIKYNSENIVEFNASDIVSLNLSPSLAHKFNALATFGFLQKKDVNGNIVSQNDIQYGAFYTKIHSQDVINNEQGETKENTPAKSVMLGVNFPWSRMSVQVESAMLTKAELAQIHANRIIFATSEIYQGSIQVRGNADVNHIYQVINVCGVYFFVISIEHSIDLTSKMWTTNYGIQCINFINPDAGGQ